MFSCHFYLAICIVCPSSIYGFRLPPFLYLQTFLTEVAVPRQESERSCIYQDRKVSGRRCSKTGKWAVMYIHICKGYWLLHLFQRFFYRILELFWQWYFCFRFITIYICTEGNYLFKIWCLFYIFVFVGRTLTSKTVLLVVTSFRWPLFVL